ncbi:MAG: hypothetical protein Kow0077_24550 [Anaerolineae bacterium]
MESIKPFLRRFPPYLWLANRYRTLRRLVAYPETARVGDVNYDDYWDAKAQEGLGKLSRFRRTRAEALASVIRPGSKVLDLGVGDGAILKYLVDTLGIEAYGLDISPKAVEYCRSIGLNVDLADINEPIGAAIADHYDYIIMSEIIEHIPDPEALLNRLRDRATALIVSVPNTGYYQHRLRLLLGRFPLQWVVTPGEHLRFWTVVDFRWWISAGGRPSSGFVSRTRSHTRGSRSCGVCGRTCSDRGWSTCWRMGRGRQVMAETPKYHKAAIFDPATAHPDDAHSILMRLIPRGSRVLELGCASGYLSGYMENALSCHVTGLEADPAAVSIASTRCSEVHQVDLDAPDALEAARTSGPYDVLLAAAVLEHLKNPETVLEAARDLLKPEARAIVSLPNIANWRFRVKLLFGQFDYTDYGVMDRTHCRLYTVRTGQALLEETGYVVEALHVAGSGPQNILNGLARRWRKPEPRPFLPGLFAYELIYVARKAN